MSECRYNRRTVLKNALVGLAALPAAGLVRGAAAQGSPPHLDEKDTLAVAMGYVHDAKKVDPKDVKAMSGLGDMPSNFTLGAAQ